MTIWFVAAAVVLIVELFIGTVYLLVVSVALAAAGLKIIDGNKPKAS